jgi:hypothetical protein
MTPIYKCRACAAIFQGSDIHSKVSAQEWIEKQAQRGGPKPTFHGCPDLTTGVADCIGVSGSNTVPRGSRPRSEAHRCAKRKATDAQIRAWAERHDFEFGGSITDLRCAFEDAQST